MLEAYIGSNKDHGIYKLDGVMPKTDMLGGMCCELKWFEWVETASFLGHLPKLGLYLGSSINVGPAINAKILLPTGQMLGKST